MNTIKVKVGEQAKGVGVNCGTVYEISRTPNADNGGNNDNNSNCEGCVKSVNNQFPDENGNVEIEASGGGSETAIYEEVSLAMGTIEAGAEKIEVNTGVTLATLREYKKFVVVFRGAEFKSLGNFYLRIGKGDIHNPINTKSTSILRIGTAGLVAWYSWLDTEKNVLWADSVFSANPSLIPQPGSTLALTASNAYVVQGGSSTTVSYRPADVSEQADTNTLWFACADPTVCSYDWEVRGVLK